ncbi:MAG TPA: transglycosylase SLT domain-containing protein [Vicinamibacteria bacterium]|nr:transglycosylase SLT domain-containing protein [Vicinamibacteria bacterium]
MLLQLSLSFALASAAASPTWRLFAEPADPAESALREAALRDGRAGIDALRTVASQYPDSTVGGLAHLAAGLRLLDLDKHAEAIAELTHADVQRTPLRDYALEGTAQAQEALGRTEDATRSYLAAAAEPASGVVCTALPRAADLQLRAHHAADAVTALEQVVAACPREVPSALLALGEAHLARGDRGAAAAAFDRLDREFPGSPHAADARAKLRPLADQLPPRGAAERARLALTRGTSLQAAGRTREAVAALRAVPLAALPTADADEARVALAGALLSLPRGGRPQEALALLRKVGAESPHAAQAAYLRGREQAKRSHAPDALEQVATTYRGSPWAEEALLSLANHYQKDALDDAALPWWRRLLAEYPQGRYVERAAWRSAWGDYRASRYQEAAELLESTARLRPPSSATAGLLYWAGRSRLAMGQTDRARQLLQETVRRYKHAYHGLRASEALAKLGGAGDDGPVLVADGDRPELPLSEPRGTRVRDLLLVERLDEAADELRLLPESSQAQATLAWIDWQHGQLRPALVTMKRAYPEWISEAGDRLPPEVWRIMFPLRYEPELRAAADEESVDAALLAALILQESTFDPAALSRAGARGLMQVMPATGRRLARATGHRYRRAALSDPHVSLDFGTHYLKQMSDRYSGSIEKVLAAYNAGPERVDAWTAERGERSAEEFIETIPFTETRSYVMLIMASREHYRRIYGLGRTQPGPVSEGARP